jgi:hypothetical protein
LAGIEGLDLGGDEGAVPDPNVVDASIQPIVYLGSKSTKSQVVTCDQKRIESFERSTEDAV